MTLSCGKCALAEICVGTGSSAGIVFVHWTHEIRHISGGAASKRSIPVAQPRRTQGPLLHGVPLAHLDGKSRRESGNTLQLPSFRKPWQTVENSIERHLPDIADHEILVHVRG